MGNLRARWLYVVALVVSAMIIAAIATTAVSNALEPECEESSLGRVTFVREDGSRFTADYRSLKCDIKEAPHD